MHDLEEKPAQRKKTHLPETKQTTENNKQANIWKHIKI